MGTNFFARTHECLCCGRYDDLHIGKLSAGWRFNFRGHPHHDPPLTSWKAWQEFLTGTQIRNEYGDELALEDLRRLASDKIESNSCQTCFVKAQAYEYDDYHDPEGHPFNDREFF
jgi:hypothetical protein